MKTKRFPSIFNDVIGPVMRGPSSSHTAAAHSIGVFIKQFDASIFTKVIVEFDRTGALATTYLGQGSAMGLAGGLLGLDMTNPEIINYEKHLKNSSFSIEYIITDIENKHPNAYQICVQYPHKDDLHILAISTGGGMFEIIEVNGNPVMPIISSSDTKLPFTTVVEMLELAEKDKLSLSELAIRYEIALSGLDSASILKKMEEIVLIVKKSIDEGLKGTNYKDRILGTQSTLIETAEKKGLIQKTINSTIIAYTSAIMEMKSSMGLIVAIPTAGSCGVVGGALFGSTADQDFDKESMVRAFLAAGITGIFIAKKYTFSAEEGGCQVETGSAAAMAAAGLVELNGGSPKLAINAASMALQNALGIICDPVAVRVEVPCLGKNIMAASNALNSSIMAIAGYDPVIPYNEVIDAMKSVGEALPSTLCCTGLGGLAQTPSGKCLNEKFNNHEIQKKT